MGCAASVRKTKPLEEATIKVLKELFESMDADHDGQVTKEEAKLFFKGKFGGLSAHAMFNEVAGDESSKMISVDQWLDFWNQVKKSGYDDKDILTEVDEMKEGGTWVDWKDSRDVGGK